MKRCALFIMITMMILFSVKVYSMELKYASQYPPKYQLSLGYNLISLKGSERVIEYYETDDSLSFKGIIEIYPLPHRFHLEVFTLTDDDYYLDTGYAYKDLLLTRLISIGMVHNHRHYDFSLPDVSPTLGYDERNPGDKYEEETSKTEFTLRLKMPNYPFHVFTRYFNYHKEGTVQQRFAIGYFDNLTKTSESRDLDFDTKELTLGTNGHFGPLEVEYKHREKNFIPGADDTLRDSYPGNYLRTADIYPHNLMPELRSSSDFIKIHTSYTGRIVGSLTLGNSRALNHYSGAKREGFYSRVQFSYLPMHDLGFFVRWHYTERDNEVGDLAIQRGVSNTLTYPLRQSIDRRTSSLSFNIKYRPFKNINILGGYTYTSIKRSDADEWPLLNQDTTKQRYSFKLYGRIIRGLKFRTEYIYTRTKDPAYNSEPEDSQELRVNTTYTPIAWLTGTVSYYFKKFINNDLRFYNYSADMMIEGGRRDGIVHNLLALITLTPLKKTTFTVGAGFYRNRFRQPLVYERFPGDGSFGFGPPFVEDGVPYKDEAIQYLLTVSHNYNDRLNMGCDLRYVLSKGVLKTDSTVTSDIGEFAELNQRETGVDIKISYLLFNRITFETALSYAEFKDRIYSDNTGRAYRALMVLTKRW